MCRHAVPRGTHWEGLAAACGVDDEAAPVLGGQVGDVEVEALEAEGPGAGVAVCGLEVGRGASGFVRTYQAPQRRLGTRGSLG